MERMLKNLLLSMRCCHLATPKQHPKAGVIGIIFLIPPSEAKLSSSFYKKEELIFAFKEPLIISKNATEKDLKCTWKRYEESINLNKNIEKSHTIESIKRYDGVMYKSIDYDNFEDSSKKYFNDNFLILSGMYGLLKPMDKIWNYKLPIETKTLCKYWKTEIVKVLNTLDCDYIVNLLPESYKKMIDLNNLNKKIIEVNFLQENWKKLCHGVKIIKWKFINELCSWLNLCIFEDIESIDDKYFLKNIYIK